MMKRWTASKWFSAHLEKEYARRTRRRVLARNVPNQRSTWQVSPSALPQQRGFTLSPKFIAYAERNHISPEALAQIWCDELARRSPGVLTIIGRVPFETYDKHAAARQRLLRTNGKGES